MRKNAQKDERLKKEIAELRERSDGGEKLWVPPGHFYSPITDTAEVERDAVHIFNRFASEFPGIDLNPARQIELFDRIMVMESELDAFPRTASRGYRYFSENNYFPFCDAFFLAGILRVFQPQHVIEVGSGFSSSVMLDVNEKYLGERMRLSFIEPYPERLKSLLRKGDEERHRIYESRVQDVPIEFFDELEQDDILFIDSSHVSKTGSDVNHLFFQVIPRLAQGTLIHVHDVPFPFEYGEPDVYEGRSWNEAYLVRAFLQYNRDFEILLYPSAFYFHSEATGRKLPDRCIKPLGPSLWLRRVNR